MLHSKKIDTLWQKVEHADLVEQMKKDYGSLGKPAKKMDASFVDSRLKLRMVPEHVRLRFVEHELRSRRFRLLPQMIAYDQECRTWKKDVLEVQEAHRVEKLQRASTPHADADMEADDEHQAKITLFRWPPVRAPSYLPSREEVWDMITRARANATDWLPLPTVAGLSSLPSKRASKKGSKSRPGQRRNTSKCSATAAKEDTVSVATSRQDDEPTSEVEVEDEEPDLVDEELEALGCRPSMMPGGIAKPPPCLPD